MIERLTVNRFELIQRLQQSFWKRWTKGYLNTLQQSVKLKTSNGNIKLYDLVLVIDEQLPPIKWRLERIVKAYTGQDGCSRVFQVKTQSGVIKRAVSKLSPLEGLN